MQNSRAVEEKSINSLSFIKALRQIEADDKLTSLELDITNLTPEMIERIYLALTSKTTLKNLIIIGTSIQSARSLYRLSLNGVNISWDECARASDFMVDTC